MYGRVTTFTLLAPSLWAVVNAVSSKLESADYKLYLFKAGDIMVLFLSLLLIKV